MNDRNPVEFTGKVLDQRNNLTGPEDGNKPSYPKRPKNVSINQSNGKKG